MGIPHSDKITKQKVLTPYAADDMPLWDGHFLIVGKCSEGKVRNVKKILFMHPLGMAGLFKIFLAELFFAAAAGTANIAVCRNVDENC